MNKNLSLAIEKAVGKINTKDNFSIAATKSDKKPEDIPTNPQLNYKNEGWISFGDWLGSGVIAASKIKFRDFISARKYVHSLKLKSKNDWSKKIQYARGSIGMVFVVHPRQ